MTATRRALLIGSQTGGLQGVEGDVERMAAALGQQRFTDIRTCLKTDASRDGILAAYDRLIADSGPDDVVCVYYSGHGNRAPNPGYQPGSGVPPVLQYLIPTDHGPDSFRGVMSFELSRCLARLTERTRNVTVILDCCHSGQMSRAARVQSLLPKGGGSLVSSETLAAFLKATAAAGGMVDVESNPHAVRLVAAEAHCIAFERRHDDGRSGGVFTEALLQALGEMAADQPVSWNAVMLRARELVISQISEQRPDAEGPRGRRVWALEQAADERPLPLFFASDAGGPATAPAAEARLRGGRLLGVVRGATYGLMPPDTDAYAPERALGTAIVEEVLGSVSRVRLEAPAGAAAPPAGSLAFPLSVPFEKMRLGIGSEVPAPLVSRIAASRYLLPGGGAAEVEPSPRVAVEGPAVVVRDGAGDVLVQANVGDLAQALDRIVDRLERVARAEDLRRLDPGGLDADLDITFGRVENGARVVMQAGEALHVGDRQFLAVENTGFDEVYVAVLGIDAAHDIQLLLRRAPRGLRLAPRERVVLGENAGGALLGVEASWPAGLPEAPARRESLIVIAANAEQDFSLLTTGTRARAGTGAASALERRLDQIRGGTPRARGARGGGDTAGSEYLLRRIDYDLSPQRRPG